MTRPSREAVYHALWGCISKFSAFGDAGLGSGRAGAAAAALRSPPRLWSPASPGEPSQPTQPEKPTTPDTPATGDSSNVTALWVVLAVAGVGIIVLVVLLVTKRKNKKD